MSSKKLVDVEIQVRKQVYTLELVIHFNVEWVLAKNLRQIAEVAQAAGVFFKRNAFCLSSG